MQVQWPDLEEAADEAFAVFIGHPEIRWAMAAWSKLAAAGLTEFNDEIQRHIVCLRFLALGGIYRDFCEAAWEERSCPEYFLWAESLRLSPAILFRLYRRSSSEERQADDSAAIYTHLVEQHRKEVAEVLIAGFGGVDELYESLWHSKDAEDAEEDECEDPHWPEMDGGRQEAYCWVSDGCPRR